MDSYVVALATGAIALGVMAFGGLSHSSHAGPGHAGAAHVGHNIGGGRASGIGARGARGEGAAGGWRWTSLLSARLLFALLVGSGAGGVAASSLAEPLRSGAAILSAAVFELAKGSDDRSGADYFGSSA